jgi:sterol 14-demethylase
MDATFAQLFTDLDGGLTPLNFMFPNLPLESCRKRDRAQKKMAQFYINIINARKEGTSMVRCLFCSNHLILSFVRMMSRT